MALKFKKVDLYEIYVDHQNETYCFYTIDDCVDFIVTGLHEFGVSDEYSVEYQVLRRSLNVYDPSVSVGEEK